MNLLNPEARSSLAQRLFGIDGRSLALFRILIALIILGDLWFFRWPNAEVFFSDLGPVTRELAEQIVGPGYWTLYGFDGSPLNAQILMATHAAMALGLLVGWRTRTMTLGCLVLAWSLQVRNPLVLSGGDVVLRLFLWWSVFLPLGRRWSLDAWGSRRPPGKPMEVSCASAALLIQFAFIYFFAGVAKTNASWLQGGAVAEGLQLAMYTKPAGEFMAKFPWLLMGVNYVVLVAEWVGPWLLFSPGKTTRIRWVLMALLGSMHLAIWLTMSIGIFSLTMIAGWVLFLPTSFWNRWSKAGPLEVTETVVDYPGVRRLGNGICILALIFVLAINLAQVREEKPAWYRQGGELFAKTFMLVQEFNLWAKPPNENPRFVFQATERARDDADHTEGSHEVDLFSLFTTDTKQKPEKEYRYYPSQSWRRFFWELRQPRPEYALVRARFEDFLISKAQRKTGRNYRWVKIQWNLVGETEP